MISNTPGKRTDSCPPDPYTLSASVPASKISVDRMTAGERHRLVAEAAYCLAERRGFEPGHELEDWLAAEKLITGVYGSQAS